MTAFIVIILTAIMLYELPNWLKRYWSTFYLDNSKRENHKQVAHKISNLLYSWINGSLIIGFIYAIVSTIAIIVLSFFTTLSTYIVWPAIIFAFICAFIPMIGSGILVVLVSIMALLYSPIAALILLIWITICWQIIDNIVRPKIFLDKINISPLIMFIATMIGLLYGGILGITISIPTVAVLQILFFEWLKTRRKKANLNQVELP
jgi:predicted PurR-regulated permease PerM